MQSHRTSHFNLNLRRQAAVFPAASRSANG